MANEIEAQTSPVSSGLNVYAVIRSETALVYDTTAAALVTYVDANYANYAVSLTEQGTTGYYVGSMPTAITAAGIYHTVVLSRAGATPSQADNPIAAGDISWDGNAEVTPDVGDSLITLSYAKAFANITSTTYDDLFSNQLIPAASAAVIQYCNRDFTQHTYTDYYDIADWTYRLLLRRFPITTLTQVTLYPYDSTLTETIDGSNYIVTRYGDISLKPTATNTSLFPRGFQTVKVDYVAGGTVPEDVKQACAILTLNLYKRIGKDSAINQEQLGDYHVWYDRAASSISGSAELQSLLGPYRDFVVAQ